MTLNSHADASLPARGAWIEISQVEIASAVMQSLPARGAWIEIYQDALWAVNDLVAPRKGSVD